MAARPHTEPAGVTANLPVAVLGAGSWGSALAISLARCGHTVRLWGHDAAQLAEVESARENRTYLPGVPLPPGITCQPDLGIALGGAADVLVVVPSHAFRSILARVAPLLDRDATLAWATKGFDPHNDSLLCDTARDIFGEQRDFAVVSGPTFATEVARGLPAAVTVASRDDVLAGRVAARLRGPAFRVYTSDDVTGVSLGGTAKNVFAIAAGIADGLGFGANTRAALITRALAELMRLGAAVGARTETFMGLSGLGDLVLTCTDDQSRNRRFGLALGRGRTPHDAEQAIGQVVEGIGSTRPLIALADAHGVELPIARQVARVVFDGLDPHAAVADLLSREPRAEHGA